MTDFLADGPGWHLGTKVVSGVWRSLITCGDVCSDTLELRGFDSCGESAEKDAVGFANTFPDIPCVSQILGGPFLRLGIRVERLSIPPRTDEVGKTLVDW